MGKDQVQQRLDQGLSGKPTLKPDEQRRYLGTFRERCLLTMTFAEMAHKQNQQHLISELIQHSDTMVLLNGALDATTQSTYMKLITQHNGHFTIVTTDSQPTQDSIGLVLAAKTAVNESVIDVEQKYPEATQPETSQTHAEKTPQKTSFWRRFFK